MGLLFGPQLVSIDNQRHAVTFGYKFTASGNVPIIPLAPFGGGVQGEQFALNLSQVSGSSVLNIGQIKAIRFTIQFPEFTSGAPGTFTQGSFIIYNPATQDFVVINGLATPDPTNGINIPTVAGVIPFVGSAAPSINFIKTIDTTGNCNGRLVATLYDFDVPPYINSGFGFLLPEN